MSNTTREMTGRLRRARLLSSFGALVLGVGLGSLLPEAERTLAPAILVAGLMAHAWGMFETHRLERATAVEVPAWAEVLYWACWAALAGLAVLIGARLTGAL
jgi:hypothetical protein